MNCMHALQETDVKCIGYVKYELINTVYRLLYNGSMKKCQGLWLYPKLRFLAPSFRYLLGRTGHVWA